MLLLLALTTTLAAPESQDRGRGEVRGSPSERTGRFPPMRLDTRVIVRPGTRGTLLFEVGTQLFRTRRFATDFNLGAALPTTLLFRGPLFRATGLVAASVDGLWEPSPFLSLGPSVAFDYRWYQQQFTSVGHTWTPSLGARIALHLLRGRWYSLCVNIKGMLDLTRTEFVLESTRIETLEPFAGHLGFRFEFGHGRPIAGRS